MRSSLRNSYASAAYALALLVGFVDQALGDPPSGAGSSDAQTIAPTGSFFSSLKQAFRQDLNYEVVRGHFDVGSPPDSHRFYCLVDVRTGKQELYGVAGEPVVRPDGMTGIKAGAVSPDSCSQVEKQGRLVTTGYVLNLGSKAAKNAPNASPVPPPFPAQHQPADLGKNLIAPDKVDVVGLKLGMSPDQVRAALKSKLLSEYFESTETLGDVDAAGGATRSIASGRFINVIAAWTTASEAQDYRESYQLMFTPVPGREHVMAIIHTVAYRDANAVRSTVLNNGLVAKYGGYAGVNELPDGPTWRVQSGGSVLTGDACERRGLFGGLATIESAASRRPNLALKTTPEEFRYQIGQCGIAIITEDQSTSNSAGAPQDRMVTRFTVTAYSPSIAFDGATTAAQLMQSAGTTGVKAQASQANGSATPNL